LVKRSVDEYVVQEFSQAYAIIHALLNKTRLPETDEYGNAVVGENGEVVWKRHPDGSVIEDWSKVDAMDMDKLVLNASVYAFFAGQRSIDLYAEAVFAKLSAEDAFDDKFAGIMSGTISDKTSSANRKVRQERYFAFYRSYLYKRVKETVDRLDTLVRRVESVRQAQLKDREREFRASRS
jgi:hypothetical protein